MYRALTFESELHPNPYLLTFRAFVSSQENENKIVFYSNCYKAGKRGRP